MALGSVQVKGMRFVIFWFRRYEKIVLERRLKILTFFNDFVKLVWILWTLVNMSVCELSLT